MRLFFILIATLLLSNTLIAQEQLGLRLDNYSGINTILINPANSINSPFKWDINLGEISFFAANNYVFLENTNVLNILSRLPNIDAVDRPSIDEETTLTSQTLIADFFDNKKKHFVTVSGSFVGPSALVQLPNRQTVGLMTRARVGVAAKGLSPSLSYYTYYNRPFEEEFSIFPFQGSVMSWSELGLHYSKGFSTYDGEAVVGLTVKYLQGYESAYFQNKDRLRYTKFPDDIISTTAADIQFGLTTSNVNDEAIAVQRNGQGIAFDLGFNFLITEYDDEYKWKIGASLIDIGRIRFDKNAQQHIVQRDTTLTIIADDYEFAEEITDLDGVIRLFSEQVLGDANASFDQDNFRLWLPAAFSMQIDYAFTNFFYLNATLIQRLAFQSPSLVRGNLLALTPRYESRWISAALPLSVYNGQQLRVGAAVRLAFLTIGSDHLGSIFTRSDFSGSDFYLALKVNPFRINVNKRGKRNRGKVQCYDFD